MIAPQDDERPQREDLQHPGAMARGMTMVTLGLLITSLAQPNVLGQLPFRILFKNQLHMDATQQAIFLAISTGAWYVKPLAGLLCDSFPLFGTRRRSYMILTSALAGLCWLLYTFAHTALQFLAITLVLNAMMVVASTVVGGLLVEVGQAGAMTGRISAIRYAIDNIILLITGPLGGFLATLTFIYTASIGAALLWVLVPITVVLLREPRDDTPNLAVWSRAADQLKVIVRSGTMWSAAGLMFLVFVAPGFGIPLNYYQLDVLHFSPTFIGTLQMLGGLGGILGSVLYAWICGRFTLRPLLYWGIFLNALSSLLYLWYHSAHAAIFIDFSNGFLSILGILPLFDLAARATPKGSESFGYALIMSVYNIAVFAVSYPLGSWLYDHWHHELMKLVWLNTGTSLLAFVLVPFLPAAMTSTSEGEKLPA
ncbi:MAG: MFS transporter [Candidatus Xenobia bacterium]